jgi:hypothetical protein
MGWEGEGGGSWEYNWECLFDNDCDNNKYDDNNNNDNAEDGEGLHGGVVDGGESDYDGCNIVHGSSFGGVGHRTLIIATHAAAAIIDDNDDDDHRRGGGGVSCPPTSGPSHCRQCHQPWWTAAAQGRSGCGRTRGGGGRSAPLYSFVRF